MSGGPELANPRPEIEAVIYRYAHLGDSGSAAELADLFHPQGVLETAHGVRAEGRDEIERYLTEIAQPRADVNRPLYVRHFVANIDIVSWEEDRASARSYFLVLTDHGLDHYGRYRDQLTRNDSGEWCFVHRYVRLDKQPGLDSVFRTSFDRSEAQPST